MTRIARSIEHSKHGDLFSAIGEEMRRLFPREDPEDVVVSSIAQDAEVGQQEVLELTFDWFSLDVIEQDENARVDVYGGVGTVDLPRGGEIEFDFFPEYYSWEASVSEVRLPKSRWRWWLRRWLDRRGQGAEQQLDDELTDEDFESWELEGDDGDGS